MSIYHINPNLRNVNGTEKLILDQRPDQDHHRNVITSRGSPVAHTTFGRHPLTRSLVVLLTDRMTDATITKLRLGGVVTVLL